MSYAKLSRLQPIYGLYTGLVPIFVYAIFGSSRQLVVGLVALGVANIFGSFFSTYLATGSFSRSAVNHESGAKTDLSGLITGIIICCVMLFMTPLFEDVKKCIR